MVFQTIVNPAETLRISVDHLHCILPDWVHEVVQDIKIHVGEVLKDVFIVEDLDDLHLWRETSKVWLLPQGIVIIAARQSIPFLLPVIAKLIGEVR